MCSCSFLRCGAECECSCHPLSCHPDHRERREAARTAVATLPDLALRVVDGAGREWAPKLNGSWACLGYNLTAATLRDLDERFIVAAS